MGRAGAVARRAAAAARCRASRRALDRQWRSVTSLFPIRQKRVHDGERPGHGRPSFTNREKTAPGQRSKETAIIDSQEPERGKQCTTIDATTGQKRDTFVTREGGRVDWVKGHQWPPECLAVEESPSAELDVKYGLPWPALYRALNIWQGEVTLRYQFAKSEPLQRLLATEGFDGLCDACIARDALRPLKLDPETILWVRRCIYHPFPEWKHRVYRWLVNVGVYRYAAGTLMGIPEMYHLSDAQVDDLMADYQGPRESCLDVGAGLGDVSRRWRRLFEEYHCTEVSSVMVRDLKRKGYTNVHNTDTLRPDLLGGKEQFDCILCINVLDRCSDPTRLLHDMVTMLRPGGRLVIALPLPLRQVQYNLGERQEVLWPPPYNQTGAFEFALAWFARDLLLRRYGGTQLRLVRLARAPYMCSGPASAPLSVIDTGIFVLDKSEHAARYNVGSKEWIKLDHIPRNV